MRWDSHVWRGTSCTVLTKTYEELRRTTRWRYWGLCGGSKEEREGGGEKRGEGGSDGHRKNAWYSEIINAKDEVVRYVRWKVKKESF